VLLLGVGWAQFAENRLSASKGRKRQTVRMLQLLTVMQCVQQQSLAVRV
jgi:hypothetical protein